MEDPAGPNGVRTIFGRGWALLQSSLIRTSPGTRTVPNGNADILNKIGVFLADFFDQSLTNRSDTTGKLKSHLQILTKNGNSPEISPDLRELRRKLRNIEGNENINLLDFLKNVLRPVVTVEIFQYDKSACDHVLACFSGNLEKVKSLEPSDVGKIPHSSRVYFFLMLCYLARMMEKTFGKHYAINRFKEIREHYEKEAMKCKEFDPALDHRTKIYRSAITSISEEYWKNGKFRNDTDNEELNKEVDAEIESYLSEKVKCSSRNYELLAVAYLAECKKFLSVPICVDFVRVRWLGNPAPGTSPRKQFVPILRFLIESRQVVYEGEEGWFHNVGKFFLATPTAKWIHDILYKFILLLVFTTALLSKRYDSAYFLLLTILLLMKLSLGSVHYGGIVRNIRPSSVVRGFIFCATLVTFVLSKTESLKNYAGIMFEVCLILSGLISISIFLRTLGMIRSISLYVSAIRSVYSSCLVFALIYFLTWIFLAVVHLSVTGEHHKSELSLIRLIFRRGAFEIFGEIRDDDSDGDYNNTSLFTLCQTDSDKTRCEFWSTMLPICVFLYVFICTIVLGSILVAKLSKLFDEQSNEAVENFHYDQFYYLLKYESTPCSRFFILVTFGFIWCNAFKAHTKFIKKEHTGKVKFYRRVEQNDQHAVSNV